MEQGTAMSNVMTVEAEHLGQMHVVARGDGQCIEMDYSVREGMAGMSPLQLVLASLAGCAANTVAALLRRADVPVTGIRVTARGVREDQPTPRFASISLELEVRGAGLDPASVQHAVDLAATTVCPVWQLLKPGVPISHELRVVEP